MIHECEEHFVYVKGSSKLASNNECVSKKYDKKYSWLDCPSTFLLNSICMCRRLCLYCTSEVSTNFEVKKEIKIKNSIKPSVGSVTSPLLLLYNCPIAYHVVNFVYFLFEYTYVRSKCTFLFCLRQNFVYKKLYLHTRTHTSCYSELKYAR